MNALRRLFVAASTTGLFSLALFTSGCPSVPGECRTTADCAAGEVCREFTCIPSGDTVPDAGPAPVTDGGQPVEDAGQQEDAGQPEEDAGTEPVEDAGPPDAGDGDAG